MSGKRNKVLENMEESTETSENTNTQINNQEEVNFVEEIETPEEVKSEPEVINPENTTKVVINHSVNLIKKNR